MKGVCAISLDKDKAFISFARLRGAYLTFLKELEVSLTSPSSDVISFLKENLETIDQKIREVEKQHSCRCGKVFLELPWGVAKQRETEEIVTFSARKKITFRDISRIKTHLENKFLNWDDFCIHNIVINCEVEGVDYEEPPLGIWAKKIKLRSLLVWIKDKMHKEIEDIFGNLDRNLAGIIAPQVSRFSSVFTGRDKAQVVVSIDYDQSRFVAGSKDSFIFGKQFEFSFCRVIEELSKRFILKASLAEEIFQRYISFKKIPYFKEITITRASGRVNLSTQTLNSFIKDYIKSQICCILQEIREDIRKDDFTVSFMGRLNAKEGFYSSLKDYVPHPLKAPLQRLTVSSSYGCLRYGVFRFLEMGHRKNEPLLRRMVDIYREYF